MKFIEDEIDIEFFKNDTFIQELSSVEDIERYKYFMRNTYSYIFYRLNRTIGFYKNKFIDWSLDYLKLILDGITSVLEKVKF